MTGPVFRKQQNMLVFEKKKVVLKCTNCIVQVNENTDNNRSRKHQPSTQNPTFLHFPLDYKDKNTAVREEIYSFFIITTIRPVVCKYL